MLKPILSLALVSAFVASRVFAASEDPVAQAYFDLAVRLSEARIAGTVCEHDAYQSTIVQNLLTGLHYDYGVRGQIAESEALRAAIGRNLGFYVAIGDWDPWYGVGLADVLEKTTFFGPATGVLGNTSKLEFAPNGVLTFWRLETEDAAGEFNPHWVSNSGAWKFSTDVNGTESVEVKVETGTKVYLFKFLESEGEVELREQGVDEGIPAFTSSPSECEA